MRKLFFAWVAAALVATLMLGAASGVAGPGPGPFPGNKLDLDVFSASPYAPDIGAIIAQSGGSSTGSGRPPRVGPNVRVNDPQQPFPDGLLGRSETTVTAVNAEKVVAGWNDAQGFCGLPFGSACTPQTPPGLSGYGYSTNGGLTWTDGGAPDPFGGVFSRCDPWLDDDDSTVFYANLAVDAVTADDLGVGVWRGSFSGSSFAWSDVQVFNSPEAAENCVNPAPPPALIPCDFYDKEAIVVGRGRNRGNAYVTLTNFQGQPQIGNCGVFGQFGFGQIEVWRTNDSGSTWQGPAVAGPEAPDSVASCGDEGTLQQSSAPAIGRDGEVYVVWQFGPTFNAAGVHSTDADIYFARSLDGGVTFDPPVKVADINSMRSNVPVGYNRSRINDHPRIDVVHNGRNRGRIYVTYYSAVAPTTSPGPIPCPPGIIGICFPQRLTSSEVFVRFSDDRGATWSAPRQIGGAVPPTGVKRWWPDVTVTSDQTVHVVYYESEERQATPDPTDIECNVSLGGTGASTQRRVGTNSSLVDTWWSYSGDDGESWSMPLKITDTTSNWCRTVSNIRPNFGDYNDAEAVPGKRVYTTWADGRNNVPDTFFAAAKAGH